MIYWTRYLMTGLPSDYRAVITAKDIVDPDTFQPRAGPVTYRNNRLKWLKRRIRLTKGK